MKLKKPKKLIGSIAGGPKRRPPNKSPVARRGRAKAIRSKIRSAKTSRKTRGGKTTGRGKRY